MFTFPSLLTRLRVSLEQGPHFFLEFKPPKIYFSFITQCELPRALVHCSYSGFILTEIPPNTCLHNSCGEGGAGLES